MSAETLIAADRVCVRFPLGGVFRRKVMRAVTDVSFKLEVGKAIALVGESGSGKSTIARVLLGLEKASSGSVVRPARQAGAPARVQVIFQDSEGALDPRMRVIDSVVEPLLAAGVRGKKAHVQAAEWLTRVGLPEWQHGKYPRQLSGGQRQRVCIARAVIGRPDVLVADEPLSALDVSLQAQLLELLAELREDLGLSMVFVSHDLSVVRHVADYVGVMYLGHMLEYGPTERVFTEPRHPYTKALLASVPDPKVPVARRFQLQGEIPSALAPPSGCVFRTRCPLARAACKEGIPEPAGADGRWARCFFSDDLASLEMPLDAGAGA